MDKLGFCDQCGDCTKVRCIRTSDPFIEQICQDCEEKDVPVQVEDSKYKEILERIDGRRGTKREEKIKAIMVEHLKSLGWPDVSNPDQLVFDNLTTMWHKIEEAGLKKPEWNIDMFKGMAVACYNETALKRHFQDLMKRARGR